MNDSVTDVMDQLAGIAPGSPLDELRKQRPDVVRGIAASDAAIFTPRDDGGLTRVERAAAALQIATLLGDRELQAHYGARLAALDRGGTGQGTRQTPDARRAAIMSHVDRVTADPGRATRAHLGDLAAAGLSPHAIVSLSQVIAYVNFQARVLAGLRMLRSAS